MASCRHDLFTKMSGFHSGFHRFHGLEFHGFRMPKLVALDGISDFIKLPTFQPSSAARGNKTSVLFLLGTSEVPFFFYKSIYAYIKTLW